MLLHSCYDNFYPTDRKDRKLLILRNTERNVLYLYAYKIDIYIGYANGLAYFAGVFF